MSWINLIRTEKNLIWFVLGIGLGIRLWGITNPLVDFHSWRQTDTATIALNFYQQDYNIFHPRLNTIPDILELEFQVYPFLVATMYKMFGFNEIYGRIVSVLFGTLTIWQLYLLVKLYFNLRTAVLAAMMFAILPMSVYYTRTFMPESTMLFFSVLGIYLFSLWLNSNKWTPYFGAVIATALAFLVKIPTLYLLIPLFYLVWQKYKTQSFVLGKWYLFLGLTILPSILWYSYQHGLYVREVGGRSIWDITNPHTLWLRPELLLSFKFYQKIFLTRVTESMLAYTGLLFVIHGSIVKTDRKEQLLFPVWLVAVCFFFIVVAYANYTHEYYQVPIILPASVLIARSLNYFITRSKQSSHPWYKQPIIITVLVLVLFIPIYSVNKLHNRLKVSLEYKKLGDQVRLLTQPEDKVVVVDDSFPEVLYYAQRKGWHRRVDEISLTDLNNLYLQGARYLAVLGKKDDLSATNPGLYEFFLSHYIGLVEQPFGMVFSLQ